MKKQIEELTPTEQLKALKKVRNRLFVGEIGCCFAPFGVLTAINFEEYFIKMEAWRTSLSFIMLAIMTLVAVGIVAKDKLKINLLNSLLVLAVIDGVAWFMGKLIQDLALIILFIIAGFIGALALELNKKKQVKEIDKLEKGIEKGDVDEIAERHKRAKEQEKIKVVIKD